MLDFGRKGSISKLQLTTHDCRQQQSTIARFIVRNLTVCGPQANLPANRRWPNPACQWHFFVDAT
jgi:hypothetical protein